jgi:hypothetical protein
VVVTCSQRISLCFIRGQTFLGITCIDLAKKTPEICVKVFLFPSRSVACIYRGILGVHMQQVFLKHQANTQWALKYWPLVLLEYLKNKLQISLPQPKDLNVIKVKVRIKVMLRQTVSQNVVVSSSLWNPWLYITFCLKVAVLFLWGALSDERSGLSPVSHFNQCLAHCQRFNIIYIVHVLSICKIY